MRTLKRLFDNNKKWAAEVIGRNPAFFERLAKQQQPEHLWIGCSDSRVLPNLIVGLGPGEVFVHRNIANQVIPSDMNCMAIIEFAVEVLQVSHIIVCGHYGCGGVEASIEPSRKTLADNWICHIREIQRKHQQALQQISDEQDRFDRLCELNVVEQVGRLCHSTIVENAWSRGKELCVHGWIYRIHDGLLDDLDLCITNPDQVSPVMAAAVARSERTDSSA